MVTKVKLLDNAIAIPSAATATTQSASDNSTKIATTAYVDTAVSGLIDSAPSNLNTLNELAAAMNDNASFFSTVLPLSGGTMSGALNMGSQNITNANRLTLADGITDTGQAGSATVFNESGSTADFRIESDSNTHMFFLDAGQNSIGINQSQPSSSYALDVGGQIRSTGNAPALNLREDDSSNQHWQIGSYAGALAVRNVTGSSYPLQINSAGNVSFGTGGPPTDVNTGYSLISVGESTFVQGLNDSNESYFSNNSYWASDSSWHRASVGKPAQIAFADGETLFRASSSAGSGSNITWTETMRIGNDGDVGIGQSNPQAKLHVQGNIISTGVVQVFPSAAGAASVQLQRQSQGTVWSLAQGNSSVDMFEILRGSSSYLAVNSNGEVGIGTASPQNTFHVNSGSANNVARFESTDTEARVLLKDTTGISYIAARNDLRFGNDTTTERMRLSSAGKLGIGVTSVNALLHLNGDGDAIRVESTNSGAGGAQVDLLHFSPSPADEDVNGVINFGGYYSGSSSAYGAAIKSVWTDVSAKEGRLEFYTRDDSTFAHHMQINHHGGIAMGENNAGYDGQILSIKAGTGDNVLYGESTDAKCIVSLRDSDSTMNIGYGATGNAHIFSQDGTEIARISTGSADKYPTSGGLGGIGGSGTNLHLLADDSEIRMANNIIHSDNSGLTKFTIRAAYGALSSGAELSLDGGYISFNTGTNFVETMRAHTGVLSIGNSTTIGSGATSYLNVGTGSGSATISIYTGTDGYGYLNFADGTSGAAADPGYMRYNHNDNTFYFNRAVSGTSFSSDQARKENIRDMQPGISGWDIIKWLKPKTFDWKKDDLTGDYLPGMGTGAAGFIAQELEEVLPNEVHGIDGEKGISPMGIIAHLVKAVQQQQETIDELKADIEALKG